MRILFKAMVGSHLYGLQTETSDEDYLGVYIPKSLATLISPFKNETEVDESIVSKDDNNKNDNDAVDCKYYRIDKFIKLLADNNPNVLEMLFIPDDKVLYCHPFFKKYILDQYENFISKRIINKFIGYAISQEKKSYVKTENYKEIVEFNEYMTNFLVNGPGYTLVCMKGTVKDLIDEAKDYDGREFKTDDEFLYVGDMKFFHKVFIKDVDEMIKDKLRRVSHRFDDMMLFDYDPKFMSHTIRLLDEGIQLLENKKIDFPFTGETHKLIMSIKRGEMNIEEIPPMVDKYKEKMKQLEDKTTLLERVNVEKIEEIYLKLLKELYF